MINRIPQKFAIFTELNSASNQFLSRATLNILTAPNEGMPDDTHGTKWCADDETPESVGRAFPALFLNPMKSRKKITFKFVPSLIVQAQKMEKNELC